MKDIDKILVSPQTTIIDAVAVIQNGGAGIALIVDEDKKLLSTVTDGDVRRAILRKIKFTEPVSALMQNRPKDYPQPVTMTMGTPHEDILRLMEERSLRQIPLVDEQGRVQELALLAELSEEEHHLPLTAVIMAGGKGQRMMPLTKNTPKPMLPLNDKPIIEHIIKQLFSAGVKDIYISTNYKAQVIKNHCGDGLFGAKIRYIHEDVPLGTAGALGLIEKPSQPVLVINGDIVTELNFHMLYDFHRSHAADITVGVSVYEMQIPYGVIETEDIHMKSLVEKPKQVCTVNAGIYLLSPKVFSLIQPHAYLNMTTLIDEIIKKKMTAICFPIQEYWLDVGRPLDYQQAQIDIKQGRSSGKADRENI